MNKNIETPPHDIEAEEALIGCCIQSSKVFAKIQTRVNVQDFYIVNNSQMYALLLKMEKESVSINVESFLRFANANNQTGITIAVLNRLISISPIPSNAEYYADIVIAKSKARAMIVAAENIRTLAEQSNTSNIFKSLVEAETIVGDVVRGYNSGIDYYNEEKYKADRAEVIDGMDWGYKQLDQWCSIPVGRATYIGSISNGGKSTFMFNVARSLNIRGKKVAIFTYEDSRFDSTIRMNYLWYSNLVQMGTTDLFPKGINFPALSFYEYRTRVRSKQDRFDEVDDVCRKFSHEHTYFFDKNLHVEEIETYVKHILNEHKELEAVFLDYLQIIPTSDDDLGYIKMKNLVISLNEISRRYNIALISACQMSVHENDAEKNDYMKLTRVREAKDIFHSCALFVGLHNETQFKSQQNGEETATDTDTGCIDILKNKTKEGVEKKKIPFSLHRNKLTFEFKWGI